MDRKYLLFFAIIVIVAIASFFVVMSSNQNKNCDAVNDQNMKNDCYHAFAHETNNKTICNKIADTEKKEHCFGHIPR